KFVLHVDATVPPFMILVPFLAVSIPIEPLYWFPLLQFLGKASSSVRPDLPSLKGLLRFPPSLIMFITFALFLPWLPRWCCDPYPRGSHKICSCFVSQGSRLKVAVLGNSHFLWPKSLSESCLHIKGVPPVLHISAFMHGHGHPELAKKLNDKIPKTVDEMFERVMALIRGKVAARSAEMVRPSQGDKGYVRSAWIEGLEKGESKEAATAGDPTPPTDEWLTIDSIILTWIFTTLSKTLQQRLVAENPTTTKEAWDILELIFNDNKRLGLPISNDDVVNIALDGLPDKYHHVFDIIIHRDPWISKRINNRRSTYSMEKLEHANSVDHPTDPTVPDDPLTQTDPADKTVGSADPSNLAGPTENVVGQYTSGPDKVADPITQADLMDYMVGSGTNRPTQRFTLHVSSVLPLPKSYKDAFNDTNWLNAMSDEYNALLKNNTWTLVPRPTDANIIRCMWLFRHKYLADGTLSRYKAHLVANDSTQVERVDVDETFSLVVKPGTIRTVLSLAISRHWPVHQLDVKNAFLHGISFTRDASGMFLSQRKYASEILEQAHMVGCNSSRTPVDTESKLGDDGDPVSDPTLYRSLAGSLQYLTFTRPGISYAVQQVCLHMHDPREPHFSALKWILMYVREAEYRRVSNAIAETYWLQNLLRELHTPLSSATLVYCDNVSVVYLSSNPVQHQRTKHIEIDIHFVRDLVVVGHVRVLHVPSRYYTWMDLEEIHVTWAYLEKKRTRLQLYTKSFEEIVHTEREDGVAILSDVVRTFKMTASDLVMASERS
nr:hypothetical protein [Tanacetum cinerariifolium]